ncbi:MAG: response regulator [Lachnospiraceae bacterium]|nr:response regulator [Lachnospiraceae bacterium]
MKKINRKWYMIFILCTIVALFVMVAYNYKVFKSSLETSLEELGTSSLAHSKEQLDGYFVRRVEVLRTTASSVEFMMENNASLEDIGKFLSYESERYVEEIDDNFTGIYGVFYGVYIDGAGWVPDENYDPTTRNWYKEAVEANGQPILVSPYVDAQTGNVMMSMSKSLSDGESIISLDIEMDAVQEIADNIAIDGMGYGIVIDENGMVVAAGMPEEADENYSIDNEEMNALLLDVCETTDNCFRTKMKGESYTVFTDRVMDSWTVVLFIKDAELFADATKILRRDIVVSLVISILIVSMFSFAFVKTNESIKLEKQSNEKVEDMNKKIIRALVRTIDAKDRYTNGHSLRVAEYSKEIARRMNKTEKEQETIYYAGLLHDVGKIRIPVDVINKPGKLTDEEYEQIKIHPVTSYHILKDIFDDVKVKNGAKFHHERYDGTGYPNGLKGENIPEIARIIGVADAYDAMASNRSYRKALPQNVIRNEIEKGKSVQFDPEIADIMLKMIDEDKDYALKESNSHQKKILVVDDEPMNIKMVSIILKDSPMYEVLGATSGNEAIEKLEEQQVDMVLLDVMMPEMDGFEIISLIREKYDMPIVFMTGDRNIETIERASKYGVDDYLTKPFLPLALKEIIHSTLN